jgi:hypothetical protein
MGFAHLRTPGIVLTSLMLREVRAGRRCDLVGWSGTFWARRYTGIVVSDEESAQVERLRYINSPEASGGA